jgi:hypothetical protein
VGAFSLICHGCRQSIVGKTAPPARYVFHTYSTTKLRHRLVRLGGFVIAALAVGSFVALTGFVGLLLHHGLGGPFEALGVALLILLLLWTAGHALAGWRAGGRTRRWVVPQPGWIIEERVR